MFTRFFEYIYNKRLTVSEHLTDNGYMSETELYVELSYCRRTVHIGWRVVYCVSIVPLVLFLRKAPVFNSLTNKIARKLWIDRAIRKELEYAKNEDQEANNRTVKS